jgi:predicted ATPase
MQFTKVEIKNFRHIKNQNIELGKYITAIAGQNGTGKSTILGWLAQSCDAKIENKTLLGKKFKSKFSEIFRFCPENDFNKKYEVIVHYLENTAAKSKKMTTRFIKSEDRYKIDYDGRSTTINYPVIYLGLKRLIPLASEKSIKLEKLDLDKETKNEFSNLTKDILHLTRDLVDIEKIKSTNKSMLAIKTESYGHLGNSAGQDNLGQIISSVLSFKILGKVLNENYNGGLLLIDEIDTTLYAGSQIKLVKKLINLAKTYNFQVIFTTHSLEILEYLKKYNSEDVKINFLKWFDNSIQNHVNPNIENIKNNIIAKPASKIIQDKIYFICEDEVAQSWANNLINNTTLKKTIKIQKGPFSHGELHNMAKSKHPIFKNIYFILDGDCRKHFKGKPPKRTIFLPGTSKPEKIFFDFIKSLNDSDSFWDHDNEFTHKNCFHNYQNEKHKNWLNDKSLKEYFGKNNSRICNRWKQDNIIPTNEFIKSIEKII